MNNFMNMEPFIEAIRKQPCLWNPQHPDYRGYHIKDDAWRCVLEEIGNSEIKNIQMAKFEWKKLRDNHRDALKRAKLGKNKLLPAQITTWKYAKAMQFLEPYMKYRITENIEFETPNETNDSHRTSCDHDVTTTESPTIPQSHMSNVISVIQPQSLKRRRENSPQKVRKDTKALESFFQYMLQTTKEMPPFMQTQVKRRIFNVIMEAEETLNRSEEYSRADDHEDDRSVDVLWEYDPVEVKTEVDSE